MNTPLFEVGALPSDAQKRKPSADARADRRMAWSFSGLFALAACAGANDNASTQTVTSSDRVEDSLAISVNSDGDAVLMIVVADGVANVGDFLSNVRIEGESGALALSELDPDQYDYDITHDQTNGSSELSLVIEAGTLYTEIIDEAGGELKASFVGESEFVNSQGESVTLAAQDSSFDSTAAPLARVVAVDGGLDFDSGTPFVFTISLNLDVFDISSADFVSSDSRLSIVSARPSGDGFGSNASDVWLITASLDAGVATLSAEIDFADAAAATDIFGRAADLSGFDPLVFDYSYAAPSIVSAATVVDEDTSVRSYVWVLDFPEQDAQPTTADFLLFFYGASNNADLTAALADFGAILTQDETSPRRYTIEITEENFLINRPVNAQIEGAVRLGLSENNGFLNAVRHPVQLEAGVLGNEGGAITFTTPDLEVVEFSSSVVGNSSSDEQVLFTIEFSREVYNVSEDNFQLIYNTSTPQGSAGQGSGGSIEHVYALDGNTNWIVEVSLTASEDLGYFTLSFVEDVTQPLSEQPIIDNYNLRLSYLAVNSTEQLSWTYDYTGPVLTTTGATFTLTFDDPVQLSSVRREDFNLLACDNLTQKKVWQLTAPLDDYKSTEISYGDSQNIVLITVDLSEFSSLLTSATPSSWFFDLEYAKDELGNSTASFTSVAGKTSNPSRPLEYVGTSPTAVSSNTPTFEAVRSNMPTNSANEDHITFYFDFSERVTATTANFADTSMASSVISAVGVPEYGHSAYFSRWEVVYEVDNLAARVTVEPELAGVITDIHGSTLNLTNPQPDPEHTWLYDPILPKVVGKQRLNAQLSNDTMRWTIELPSAVDMDSVSLDDFVLRVEENLTGSETANPYSPVLNYILSDFVANTEYKDAISYAVTNTGSGSNTKASVTIDIDIPLLAHAFLPGVDSSPTLTLLFNQPNVIAGFAYTDGYARTLDDSDARIANGDFAVTHTVAFIAQEPPVVPITSEVKQQLISGFYTYTYTLMFDEPILLDKDDLDVTEPTIASSSVEVVGITPSVTVGSDEYYKDWEVKITVPENDAEPLPPVVAVMPNDSDFDDLYDITVSDYQVDAGVGRQFYVTYSFDDIVTGFAPGDLSISSALAQVSGVSALAADPVLGNTSLVLTDGTDMQEYADAWVATITYVGASADAESFTLSASTGFTVLDKFGDEFVYTTIDSVTISYDFSEPEIIGVEDDPFFKRWTIEFTEATNAVSVGAEDFALKTLKVTVIGGVTSTVTNTIGHDLSDLTLVGTSRTATATLDFDDVTQRFLTIELSAYDIADIAGLTLNDTDFIELFFKAGPSPALFVQASDEHTITIDDEKVKFKPGIGSVPIVFQPPEAHLTGYRILDNPPSVYEPVYVFTFDAAVNIATVSGVHPSPFMYDTSVVSESSLSNALNSETWSLTITLADPDADGGTFSFTLIDETMIYGLRGPSFPIASISLNDYFNFAYGYEFMRPDANVEGGDNEPLTFDVTFTDIFTNSTAGTDLAILAASDVGLDDFQISLVPKNGGTEVTYKLDHADLMGALSLLSVVDATNDLMVAITIDARGVINDGREYEVQLEIANGATFIAPPGHIVTYTRNLSSSKYDVGSPKDEVTDSIPSVAASAVREINVLRGGVDFVFDPSVHFYQGNAPFQYTGHYVDSGTTVSISPSNGVFSLPSTASLSSYNVTIIAEDTDNDAISHTFTINLLDEVDVDALTRDQGFRIHASNTTNFGFALAATDLNGDNYIDLFFGDPMNQTPGLPGKLISGTVVDLIDGAAFAIWGHQSEGVPFSTGIESPDINSFGRRVDFTTLGDGEVVFREGDYSGITSPTIEVAESFGYAIAAIGDTNGDGIEDIAFSAPDHASNPSVHEGKVYVLYGDFGSEVADNDYFFDTVGSKPGELASGNGFIIEVGMNTAGLQIAGGGDYNADGLTDIIIADASKSTFAGEVHIVYGRASDEVSGALSLDSADEATAIKLTSTIDNTDLGMAVAGVGDFNNDGIDDLVLGSPGDSSDVGAIYIVYGNTNGLGTDFNVADLATVVDGAARGAIIRGTETGGRFGSAVAVGDYNGDGSDDLLVGAPDVNGATDMDTGFVYAIFGGAHIDGDVMLSGLGATEVLTIRGAGPNGHTGSAVASGDIDGDGIVDMIISSPYVAATDLGEFGRASVIFGRTDWTNYTATNLTPGILDLKVAHAKTAYSGWGFFVEGFENGSSGTSVMPLLSGIDANADGFDDFVVTGLRTVGSATVSSSHVIYGSDLRYKSANHAPALYGTSESSNEVLRPEVQGADRGLFYVDGGSGFDSLELNDLLAAFQIDLDLTDGVGAHANKFHEIEMIDISSVSDPEANTVTITDAAIRNIEADSLGAWNSEEIVRSGLIIRVDPIADAAGFDGDRIVVGDGFAFIDRVVHPNVRTSTSPFAPLDMYRYRSNGNELITNDANAVDRGSLSLITGVQDEFVSLRTSASGNNNLQLDLDSYVRGGFGSWEVEVTLNVPDGSSWMEVGTFSVPNVIDNGNMVSLSSVQFDASLLDPQDNYEIYQVVINVQDRTARADPTDMNNGVDVVVEIDWVEAYDPEFVQKRAGFALTSSGAADDGLGGAITAVGDFNRDGVSDFAVAMANGNSNAGEVVLFLGNVDTESLGTPAGAGRQEIDISDWPAASSLRIQGDTADLLGSSISHADINNDGYSDLIIGAAGARKAYVVYGVDNLDSIATVSGSSRMLAIADLAAATGVTIDVDLNDSDSNLHDTDPNFGIIVQGLTDIDGDGNDEVAISNTGADIATKANHGETYVVFGASLRSTLMVDTIDIVEVTSTPPTPSTPLPWFRISGENVGTGADVDFGASIASLGNFLGSNMETNSSFFVGATGSAAGYVFRGQMTVSDFADTLDPNTLTLDDGFTIAAPETDFGTAAANIGDANGDGYDDLAISAPSTGMVYVIFGANGTASLLDGVDNAGTLHVVDDLNSDRGFSITGNSSEGLGMAISAAGDVNGDGFDDFLIGAPSPDTATGAAYLIYGAGALGTASTVAGIGTVRDLSLSGLDQTDGYRIAGVDGMDAFGTSLSNLGDINGDGLADFAIGEAPSGADGAVNVFYGFDF